MRRATFFRALLLVAFRLPPADCDRAHQSALPDMGNMLLHDSATVQTDLLAAAASLMCLN
eukprot:SAG11_NODE_2672_length_3110_cov_2.425108_3_plen_60_part_00